MSWFTSLLSTLKKLFLSKDTPVSEEQARDSLPHTQNTDIQESISEILSIEESLPNNPVEVIPPAPPVSPDPENDEKLIVEKLAKDYGFNPRTVRAIAKVESSGNPFRQYKGLGLFPVLRFEPHWFNKYEKKNPMPFTNNGKGFSSIVSETNHVAFQKALSVNTDAAIKATSFGKFQIMGFHFSKLGYKTPSEFLEAMKKTVGQYDAFVKFVMTKQTLRNIIMKETPTLTDFKAFAKAYNGSSNVENYSKKMEKAYNSLS